MPAYDAKIVLEDFIAKAEWEVIFSSIVEQQPMRFSLNRLSFSVSNSISKTLEDCR